MREQTKNSAGTVRDHRESRWSHRRVGGLAMVYLFQPLLHPVLYRHIGFNPCIHTRPKGSAGPEGCQSRLEPFTGAQARVQG